MNDRVKMDRGSLSLWLQVRTGAHNFLHAIDVDLYDSRPHPTLEGRKLHDVKTSDIIRLLEEALANEREKIL